MVQHNIQSKISHPTLNQYHKKGNKQKDNVVCFHCGKSNHSLTNCKYRTYKCKICSKIENLTSMCRRKETIGSIVENDSQCDNVNSLDELN